MPNSLALVWDLIAVDHASATFARTGAAADGLAGSTKRLMEGFGLLSAGGAVVGAVKQAAAFQSQMLLLQTQAGATADGVRKISPAVLSLAGQTAQAPEALATAMYHAYSVTQNMGKSLDITTASAKLATISHSDLEQTTNALTAAVASGIPGISNMNDAVGALNATVGAGDMKMSDLNEALGSGLLTVVKGYGLNMADVSAALATFGDNNIRGADAATMLRMAVQSMAVPVKGGRAILADLGITTAQSSAALKKIGITTLQLAGDMQTGGLNKAVTDLRDHLDKAGVSGDQVGSILTAAFGKKAGPGVAVLLGQFDRLQQKYVAVNTQQKTFSSEWDATTKSASFQFHSLTESVDAIGIKLGTALLPPLSEFAGWLVSTGIPDVEKFGSALVGSAGFKDFVSGAKTAGEVAVTLAKDLADFLTPGVREAARLFGELPAPVQAVAFAFAAVRLANLAGIFDPLLARGGQVLGFMKNLGGSTVTTVQQMRTSFTVAKAAQEDVLGAGGLGGTLVSRATSNLAGLGAAAGTLASRGFGAVTKAGMGVIDMLGGPWMVTIGGVTAGVAAAVSSTNNLSAALGKGGQVAQDAVAHYNNAENAGISLGGLWDRFKVSWQDGISQFQGYSSAMDQATQKSQAAHDALPPLQRAQQDVTKATNDLNLVVNTFGTNSSQAQSAALLLGLATGDVAVQQAKMDAATRGANGALSGQISLQQQLSQAGLSFDQANVSALQAIDQYTAGLKNANLTESARSSLLYGVEQSIFGVMDAAKQRADAETKGMAASVTTDQEIVRQRDALDAVVKTLGFVPPALQTMYDDLNGPTAAALKAATTHVGEFGTSVNGLPAAHNTVITADTGPADGTLNAFLARVQANGFAGAIFNLGKPIGSGANPSGIIGLPAIPGRAFGGPISGAGTGTSDSILIAASNGEHMWAANEVTAAGGHAGVAALRKAVLAAGHGLAGGGPVPTGMNYPLDFSAAVKSHANGYLTQLAASASSVGGGVERWRPIVDTVLGLLGQPSNYDSGVLSMIQSESGGNPNAINLTDSNALAGHPSQGLMQTIPGTFAAYAGPFAGRGITDPMANIYAGVNYALSRYGAGILASGGRHSASGHYIGYKDGTNYIPADQLAMLHQGEAVVPAEENQGTPYQSGGPAVFHLYDSDGALLGTMRGVAQQETTSALNATASRMQFS